MRGGDCRSYAGSREHQGDDKVARLRFGTRYPKVYLEKRDCKAKENKRSGLGVGTLDQGE